MTAVQGALEEGSANCEIQAYTHTHTPAVSQGISSASTGAGSCGQLTAASAAVARQRLHQESEMLFKNNSAVDVPIEEYKENIRRLSNRAEKSMTVY